MSLKNNLIWFRGYKMFSHLPTHLHMLKPLIGGNLWTVLLSYAIQTSCHKIIIYCKFSLLHVQGNYYLVQILSALVGYMHWHVNTLQVKDATQRTLRSQVCFVFIFRLMSTLKLVWFVIFVLKNLDSTRIMVAAVVRCLLLRTRDCSSRRRISEHCNKGSDIDHYVLTCT